MRSLSSTAPVRAELSQILKTNTDLGLPARTARPRGVDGRMGSVAAVDAISDRPSFSGEVEALPLGGTAKRALDLVLASGAIVLLAPLMLLVSAAIAVLDGGPIMIRHMRIGAGGRLFPCFKFRTMVLDGDEVIRRHFERNQEALREWKETQKLKDDPRVTPIGAILRKTSIDELPQLFNVLRGEMSLVGPRPITAEEATRYGRALPAYLRTRPGITGAWQVSGRSMSVSYAQRVKLDEDYVHHWSLTQDLVILVKTIPCVLLSRGSY